MRLGLRGKLALVLGGITVIAFGLIYLSVSRFIANILADEEMRTLSLTADTVMPLVVELPQDRRELDAALGNVKSVGRLAALQILSPQMETMAPGECTPAEVLVGRDRLKAIAGSENGIALVRSPALGQTFAALRPLPGGGFLFAARTAEGFEHKRDSITTLLILWGLVLVLALLAAGSVLLRHVVMRPIDKLLAEAGAVATGGRVLTPERIDSDEFGLLRTSLRTMAERIRTDRNRIEQHVEELTRVNQDLTEAQEQLIRTEKLASVGQLAAGVAHEIGNPMSIILGYLDLLDQAAPTEKQKETLVRIRKNVERIDRTLRNLMDFSHPAGDDEGTCVVAADTKEIVDLVSPQKAFRGLALEVVNNLPKGATAEIPPSRFKQVLLNLLMNAADALAGKGRITVTLDKRGDAKLSIKVADDGPGIPHEHYLKVFDPFFTTKEVGKGTGLGLFVCHTIATRYGGDITLESKVGAGAAFTVVLPVAGGR